MDLDSKYKLVEKWLYKKQNGKSISERKHHYSALNAVAAKILRIVYWVLKNKRSIRHH